jgi:hypothetical protein
MEGKMQKNNKVDALRWIRKIRKKHYEETKNMTTQERIEYDMQKNKNFDEWLQKRRENKK